MSHQNELPRELAEMHAPTVEPLLPIEKKLIAGSLITGIVLLGILLLVSRGV